MTQETAAQPIVSLYEQTRGLDGRHFGRGNRRTGDVLTVVRSAVRREAGISFSRAQLQLVIESVPAIFPEDWHSPFIRWSPSDICRLNQEQQVVFYQLQTLGPRRVTGPNIEKIVSFGVRFRNRTGK